MRTQHELFCMPNFFLFLSLFSSAISHLHIRLCGRFKKYLYNNFWQYDKSNFLWHEKSLNIQIYNIVVLPCCVCVFYFCFAVFESQKWNQTNLMMYLLCLQIECHHFEMKEKFMPFSLNQGKKNNSIIYKNTSFRIFLSS